MKIRNANFMLSILAISLFGAALFFSACSDDKIAKNSPEAVVRDFILLCEAGKMDDAQKLLASKNNVDYFKKYKAMGKDMIFIGHDYKGNDDVIEIEFLRKNQNDEIAIVGVSANYKIQQHKFNKDVILHNENGAWKIYEYPSLYPVKVK